MTSGHIDPIRIRGCSWALSQSLAISTKGRVAALAWFPIVAYPWRVSDVSLLYSNRLQLPGGGRLGPFPDRDEVWYKARGRYMLRHAGCISLSPTVSSLDKWIICFLFTHHHDLGC